MNRVIVVSVFCALFAVSSPSIASSNIDIALTGGIGRLNDLIDGAAGSVIASYKTGPIGFGVVWDWVDGSAGNLSWLQTPYAATSSHADITGYGGLALLGSRTASLYGGPMWYRLNASGKTVHNPDPDEYDATYYNAESSTELGYIVGGRLIWQVGSGLALNLGASYRQVRFNDVPIIAEHKGKVTDWRSSPELSGWTIGAGITVTF